MSAPNTSELAAILTLKDEMTAPLQKAKASLQSVGTAFQGLQQKASQSLKPLTAATASAAASTNFMASSFGTAERAQLGFLRRIGAVTNRLLALHFTVSQLGDNLGRGTFGSGIKAAMGGLGTFTGILAAMPNKIGLGIAAVGGLAAAFAHVKQEINEIEEKSKKLAANLAKNIKKATDTLAGKDADAAAMAIAGKSPEQIRTVAALAEQEGRLLEIYKQQRQFQQELEVIEQSRANRGNLNDQKRLDLLQKIAKSQEMVNALSKAGFNAADPERAVLAALTKQLKELDDATKKEADRVAYLSEQLVRLAGNEKEARQAAKEFHDELEQNEKLQGYSEEMQKLEEESFQVGLALQAGLVSPLEAAKRELEIIEKKMGVLLRAGDLAPSGSLEEHERKRLNAQYDVDVTTDFENLEKDRQKVSKELEEDMKRATEEYHRQWEYLFESIGQGFSDVFADAIVEGKSLTKGLNSLFKDLQKSIIRMVMDTALGGMFRSAGAAFGNTMAPAFGIAPMAPGAAPGQAPGQPPSVNINQAAQAGVSAFSFGGAGQSPYMAAGVAVGTAAGGYVMQRGVSSGNTTMGAAGGALAGAAMGAVFGPVGIVVGAIAGAALGYFSANDAKEEEEKMKERQREQEEAARLQHEAMVEKAKGLIKLHVRTNMGGGLATEEAMADVSELFSGDISAEEVEKFGAENVVARQAEIEGQAGAVDVGGIQIHVNANVSGNYDVQRLAESLGYHVQRQIQVAAAGAGV